MKQMFTGSIVRSKERLVVLLDVADSASIGSGAGIDVGIK
jgi:hypothetical protein